MGLPQKSSKSRPQCSCFLHPNLDMAKNLLFSLLACAVQVKAALLPLEYQAIESHAITAPAAPQCTTNSDVVVNGAFFGYPHPSTYAPWTLTTTGSPGCRYISSYNPCQGFTTGFGDSDPNCLYVLRHTHFRTQELTRIPSVNATTAAQVVVPISASKSPLHLIVFTLSSTSS